MKEIAKKAPVNTVSNKPAAKKAPVKEIAKKAPVNTVSNKPVVKKTPKKLVKKEEAVNAHVLQIPKNHRYLDNLARLFESNSKNCSAVCLINKTLLISDNGIFDRSRSDNQKIQLINETMAYFSSLKEQKPNEKKAEIKAEIFYKLAMARLKGEDGGYLKLSENHLDYIINYVIDQKITNSKKEKVSIDEITYEKQFTNEQRGFVANATLITQNLLRDFNNIFNLLTNEKKRNDPECRDLINAIDGEEKSLVKLKNNTSVAEGVKIDGKVQSCRGESTGGYLILKYDKNKVHAETKIVAYLLLVGALDKLPNSDKDLYIGISKLCCASCHKFIENVNELVKVNIKVRGTHGLQPAWTQPEILKDATITNNEIFQKLAKSCPNVEKVSPVNRGEKVSQVLYSPSSEEDTPTKSPFSSLKTNTILDRDSLTVLASAGQLNQKDIEFLKTIITLAEKNLKTDQPELVSPKTSKKSLSEIFDQVAIQESGKAETLLHKRKNMDNNQQEFEQSQQPPVKRQKTDNVSPKNDLKQLAATINTPSVKPKVSLKPKIVPIAQTSSAASTPRKNKHSNPRSTRE